MPKLYFPLAACFIAIILIIIYFLKRKLKTTETRIFGFMLIASLLDTIFACIIEVLSYTHININLFNDLLTFLNKTDFMFIIMWLTLLLTYIVNINYTEKTYNYSKKITLIMYCISGLIILFSKLNLIITKDVLDVSGLPVYVLYFNVIIYILFCLFLIILKYKKINKKIIPFIVFVLLIIIVFIMRFIYPDLDLAAAVIAYVNLIMYFTIENPDLKLIEEIKQAKDKSDQINADKSAFIFNIIQEVKNRSTEMNEYINESLTYDNINDIKSNIYKLQESLDRANKTINQTLDISEEDIIKIEKIDNKYNIKNLIKETTLQSKEKVKEEIDFRITIDNNIPEILYGDSVKIKQILTTIMDNAIKYTEKGFIELRIDSIIKYEICRLLITLEDSGSGIDGETISEIFSQNTNNEYISKNLTLNSVNKIISLIGGTFDITSKINHGTKITITVDQQIPEEESNNNKVTEYVKELKIPKVLLVDENVKKLEKIKRMFKNENIYVDYVIMGEQCLRKIRNNEKFDLIIMDYEIPKINGLEVYNKLKEEGYNIPVIITTDSEDEKVKEKYKYFGVYDVINNPIKKKDIKEIIEYLKNNQK